MTIQQLQNYFLNGDLEKDTFDNTFAQDINYLGWLSKITKKNMNTKILRDYTLRLIRYVMEIENSEFIDIEKATIQFDEVLDNEECQTFTMYIYNKKLHDCLIIDLSFCAGHDKISMYEKPLLYTARYSALSKVIFRSPNKRKFISFLKDIPYESILDK